MNLRLYEYRVDLGVLEVLEVLEASSRGGITVQSRHSRKFEIKIADVIISNFKARINARTPSYPRAVRVELSCNMSFKPCAVTVSQCHLLVSPLASSNGSLPHSPPLSPTPSLISHFPQSLQLPTHVLDVASIAPSLWTCHHWYCPPKASCVGLLSVPRSHFHRP